MNVCAACGAALPEAARFCPTCAAPVEAKPDETERKLATMVFADLVGSTELGGSQDPEQTRALLDRFYDAMSAEIETAGGTVEKFVGDAVMAVFGAPAALEDHAERALHAALAMQRRLRELFGDTLALRIGVNTGEVVVGKPREGSSFVTGDSVNVAARLEQAAEPGEIVVGERTVATARGAFEFDEPRTIAAKGKPEGVECRRLVRALSLMRPRGVGGLRRAFVGRDEEVSVLERAYEAVDDERQAQLVTILGDAGVGKTRLLREFWDLLGSGSPQTVRRTGRCLAYGQGITYWPLGEVLKEHLGVLDSDPSGVVLERLGSREILGLTLGLDVAHGLHPLAARDRFQDAWVEFLEEMVAERPAVMLIEDVHWAEEQLLDLLERLVRDTRGPLLLVATARPELLEQRPGWGARVRGATVALEALSPENAVRMLDELLGGALPLGLEEVVVQRAEGNPFFVEELLATLIDRQLLERQAGSWRLAQPTSDFSVPDTVQAVVAARVDLLEPAEKQALQAAAVIGRVFWAGPVYELVPEVEPDLRVLEERDFVRRRAGSSIAGEREYAIKHALTREVAYGSLTKAKRAQLHGAFAGWLERSGEGNDEQATLLAHHYAEAVRREDVGLAWPGQGEEVDRLRQKAASWSRRAGQRAVGRYEIDEGLALLHRALEFESNPTEQATVWLEIGHANALKYDGEAFTTAMQKAIELGGPSADVYTDLAFQTVQRAGMWKRRPDPKLVSSWIEQALELTTAGSLQRAKALVSRALWDDDEADAAEALELAVRLGDVELRSHALDALGNARYAAADFDRACALLEERLGLLAEISNPDHRAETYLVACDVYTGAGRFADARRSVALLAETAEGLTPHHRLHAIGCNVRVESLAGRWAEVRQLSSRAEGAVEANLATPCPLNVGSLLLCAIASAQTGDEDEAHRLEAKADAIGMEGYGMFFHPKHLRLALVREDLVELRRLVDALDPEELEPWAFESRAALFDALIALGDLERIESDAPPALQPGTYLDPFALRALGFARDDAALLADAAARFEAMGLDWHAGETRKLLSR